MNSRIIRTPSLNPLIVKMNTLRNFRPLGHPRRDTLRILIIRLDDPVLEPARRDEPGAPSAIFAADDLGVGAGFHSAADFALRVEVGAFRVVEAGRGC